MGKEMKESAIQKNIDMSKSVCWWMFVRGIMRGTEQGGGGLYLWELPKKKQEQC